MSEVKRYEFRPSQYAIQFIGVEIPSGKYISAEDYDAAQSELAALREELASRNEVIEMKAREVLEAQTAVTGWAAKCKAAEQRNAELSGLLSKAKLAVDDVAENCEDQTDWSTANSMHALSEQIKAALKPTESGASE